MAFEKLLVRVLDELVIKGARPEQESIVKRSVKKIDGSIDIKILPQGAFCHRLAHHVADSFPAWLKPAITKRNRKLLVRLCFRYERTDESPPRTAKKSGL